MADGLHNSREQIARLMYAPHYAMCTLQRAAQTYSSSSSKQHNKQHCICAQLVLLEKTRATAAKSHTNQSTTPKVPH